MKNYLSLIKFSHTIFALPFALVGFFLASHHVDAVFSWQKLLLVILCMVFARTAAMAFNRWQDRDIDAINPRTKIREIPAGILSSNKVLIFVIINCCLFIATTFFINPLCFYLSPIALLIVLGYSFTKRFTFLCHLILGMGLALAPVGAYLAVTGSFDLLPIIYGFAVLFWTAGFDIIYALQDEEFDKENQLQSIPVLLGKDRALMLSNILHLISGTLMIVAGFVAARDYTALHFLHFVGLAIFISLLIYQHTLVKANDLSKVNLAFFTTNGLASLVFGSLFILDFYI
ncbi:MAG: UbiA family prenyltransferase [Saprospiraceae bacterium]|nr:UbiA family prenyltransferase [Saprospiraceae bacterium]